MGKVFFNIGKATPDVIVSSDGLRDPLRIRTTQALGGFGALPPYFLLRDTDGVRTADADEIRTEMTTVGTIKSVMPLRQPVFRLASKASVPIKLFRRCTMTRRRNRICCVLS